MIANYHTHTWRCRHADGTEREYVERAIEGGLKILGFFRPFALSVPGWLRFRHADAARSGGRLCRHRAGIEKRV